MNVLLVGSGGREHALAWKLRQSPLVEFLFALPGSSAIADLAQCVPGDPNKGAAVAMFCKENKIRLVVVGPEAPLAAGLADVLRAEGIAVFGPGKEAAQLESSKAYAKEFMKRHGIPTAASEVYDDAAKARDAAAEIELPVVVKADGLAAGKGVRICNTRQEAIAAVQDFMVKRELGDSGARVVLEQFLEGPEVTVLALCDGEAILPLAPSRDHKRVWDDDLGPNTGGMGAFAPVAIDAETDRRIRTEVLDRVLKGLNADALDYRGVIYCGLMLTKDGPKVLEFNVRFGDPETQAVMPLLKSDFAELAQAAAERKLKGRKVEFHSGAAVCVVIASEGYPGTPATGRTITGLEKPRLAPMPAGERISVAEDIVFHAGTVYKDNRWTTTGGRVLGVSAHGADVAQARSRAYATVRRIQFEGMHFRGDIAVSGLERTASRGGDRGSEAGDRTS
ncbi:MAG: phosphoribosylamine--glycine ligase [Proteobacteria bacterium]|nr:phosphoribosylamine--glycine ligase [Pseudomonadota bacterium]